MRSLQQDPQLAALRSAWGRYVVLLAGVALVFLIVTIVVWPWPYDFAVERFMLPQYERAFGFRGGRLPVTMGEANFTIYALVVVEPGGRMARAGAISGDIPVEYHGGLWAFYGAVLNAASSKEGHFHVLAHSDWPEWAKRRKIVLLPEAPPR